MALESLDNLYEEFIKDMEKDKQNLKLLPQKIVPINFDGFNEFNFGPMVYKKNSTVIEVDLHKKSKSKSNRKRVF